MRAYYIVIPLIAISVSVIGSLFTASGLREWYQGLNKPSFTPPGGVIGAVWTVIYILSTISALTAWNSYVPWGTIPRDSRFWWITGFFIANAFLNTFWCYLFFSIHKMYASFWEAVLMDLTVIALMVLIWPISITASLLLLPYAAWVAFASYLTYALWSMNK
jgi:tryptophan-rich sensory protein